MSNKTVAPLIPSSLLQADKGDVPPPAVICRACFVQGMSAHFDGWEEYADHVLAEHPEDKHRMMWVTNAKADVEQRIVKEAAKAAEAEATALTKQLRLKELRGRVQERMAKLQTADESRRAKLREQLERRKAAVESRSTSGHKPGKLDGHHWWYWLFTERRRPPKQATVPVTETSLTLWSPEAMIDRLKAKDRKAKDHKQATSGASGPESDKPSSSDPAKPSVPIAKPARKTTDLKKQAKPPTPEAK